MQKLKVSAFSYVRNGIRMGYPFLQSIQSVLPVVDEFIMVVGDSTDGTREAILALSPKIKIIDSVWDMKLRSGGKIFAQQANLGLDAVTGDWIIHIQADEVIHEQDIEKVKKYMDGFSDRPEVEGFLFPFLNFRATTAISTLAAQPTGLRSVCSGKTVPFVLTKIRRDLESFHRRKVMRVVRRERNCR